MMNSLKALNHARRFFADPTKGIEYNKLIPNKRVSKCIYVIDIARNPQIVNYFAQHIDVQFEARFANFDRDLIDRQVYKITGRLK